VTADFKNLAELCKISCQTYAERPLFGTKTDGQWSWLTYGEFHERVNDFRGGLAALGVGEGDRVAMIGDNRVGWAVAAYATYGLSGAFVPMYQAQKPDEWRFILDDCGAKVVLTATKEIYDTISHIKPQLPNLEHVLCLDLADDHEHSYRAVLARGKDHPAEMQSPESESVAGYIYTSGTTGNPKGVLLSHRNICSNINAVKSLFDLQENDRSLSFLPWAHAFGQTCELHLLLSKGASMGINDDIPKLVANLAEVKPTVLYAVPRIFNKIYDRVNAQISEKPALIQNMVARAIRVAKARSEGRPVGFVDKLVFAIADRLVFEKIRQRFGGRLRYAISGSAALSTEVGDFIDALGILVYEGYGLSETSPIATCNYPGNRKMGSVGKALPGVRIEIDKSVTGDDKLGEIIIHGPNVMMGYHNRPDEQAKVFTEDGGLKTGDTGYLDDEGYLFIRGRIKEQYKLENGKYVMPAPLEEMLKLSPYISNVMLDGANRPYNIAVLVPEFEALGKWAQEKGVAIDKASSSPEVRELMAGEVERFSGKFKGYEKPHKFVVADEEFTTDNGMLTPTMKLKRVNVLSRYKSQIDALYQ